MEDYRYIRANGLQELPTFLLPLAGPFLAFLAAFPSSASSLMQVTVNYMVQDEF